MANTLRIDLRKTLLLLKRVPVLGAVIAFAGGIVRSLDRVIGDSGDGEALRALKGSAHPAARKVLAALVALSEPPPPVAGAIEAFRLEMVKHKELLADGSLAGAGPSDAGIRVGEVCRVSKPPRQCHLLYLLAREFGAHSILELGTNLGISSAYLGSATAGRVVTLDASPYRLRLAGQFHESLGLRNVQRIAGLFSDTLPGVLQNGRAFDLVFIDGHHLYRSTLDYCSRILPSAAAGAVFIFDDIRWSDEMQSAWGEVSGRPAFSLSVDLGEIGLCVVRGPGDPERAETIPRIDGWLRARGLLATRNPY